VRARVVAPATTRRHDRIVCHVSLCQDYADFCVKTMYCCAKTEFLLIYVLCDCCILFLLHALFLRLPIQGCIQNRGVPCIFLD
jgi:hypothetical protein